MSAAVDALRAEHRVIERALDALEALVTDDEADRAGLVPLVDFFRAYADAWHHGREEDLLFAAVAEAVSSDQMESLVDLLEEHEEGRRLVAELASDPEPRRLAELVAAYCGLLRAHILREDQLLFPLAETRLSPATQDELDRQFARYPVDKPPDWGS